MPADRRRAERTIDSDRVASSRVGLVGCGILGRALGARLLKAGTALTVFDCERASAEYLLQAGATWAGSPAELAAGCAFTISCLPDPRTVESVALGPSGLWAGADPGTIHLETSTVGPACVKKLAREASAVGIRFIDSPISRGAPRDAPDGDIEFVLWIGASPDHFDLARPILDRLGDHVVYCGGVGLGQTTKIVNNFIAHGIIVLVSEALALGVRAGASLDLLSTVLRHGTAQNRVLDELLPESAFQGNFEPGLRLDLALKDLDLAQRLACEQSVELVMAGPVRELFEQARTRGWGELSAHTVVRVIEERSGVRLRSLLADAGEEPS